MGEDDVEC